MNMAMISNVLYQPTCFLIIIEDQFCTLNIQVSLKSILQTCIDLSLTDLSKLIGQEWAKLNESQQKVREYFFVKQ